MRYGWKPKRVRESIPSESVLASLPRLPACWTVMSVPFTSDPESKRRVVANSFRSFTMGKKLYVGNLSYNVSSSDLEQLFSQFGSVQSAQVITDRDTGRGKGFGFVEMSNEAEAQEAIRNLHDQDHGGRRLTVNEARPREPRPGGGGGGGYGGGGSRGGGRDRY